MSPAASNREQRVAEAFVSLADTLVDDYDYDPMEMLTRLVGYCVELLSVDAGSVVLADPGGARQVAASSNEDARSVALMELRDNEGPCLDCYRGGAPVNAPDLRRSAGRWPAFVTDALREPVFHGVAALPLRRRQQVIGALNLWRRRAGPLPAADLPLGQALATMATIAILHDRALRQLRVHNKQLQTALTSRLVLEQAKGMLAQHAGLPMAQAFEAMHRYARSHQRRLPEVARELTERTLDPSAITAAHPPPGTGPPGPGGSALGAR
jgi:hypothetical protein